MRVPRAEEPVEFDNSLEYRKKIPVRLDEVTFAEKGPQKVSIEGAATVIDQNDPRGTKNSTVIF